jgi:hypothetical protein
LMLSERALARWWCLVAFMKATNHLHRAMRAIVPQHRNGHRNGQQSGYMCIIVVLIDALAAAGAIRSD